MSSNKINLSSYQTEAIYLLCMVLGFVLFYWVGLSNHYLLQPDEARYSEIAREMFVSGNFVTPLLNHMVFFDKPAMYYWLTAFAMKLFGVTEFAARFFPAVFGIVGIIATYFFTRFIANKRTAFIAAVVLGTAPLFWGAAHYSNMDLLVAIFVTISLYAFWVGIHLNHKKMSSLFLYTSYAFSAIAILTKGLLGFVFPCMVIGLWILCCNQWRVILKMRLITGLILIAVIIFPWFYLVQKQNPEFFHYFFVIQQWQRYLTQNFNSQHGLWFYPTFIILGLMPWGIFIFNSICQTLKDIWHKTENAKLYAFLLIWFFSILIFFSIPSSKLVGYILPVLPPMAILLAIQINKLWEKYPSRMQKIFITLVVLTVIVEVTLMLTMTTQMNKHSTKPIALKIQPLLDKNIQLVTYSHNYYDLSFYTGQPVYIVANWDKPNLIDEDNWKSRFLYAAVHHPNEAKYLLSEAAFKKFWNSKQSIVVIIRSSRLKKFKAYQYYVIAEAGGYTAVSNQSKMKNIL